MCLRLPGSRPGPEPNSSLQTTGHRRPGQSGGPRASPPSTQPGTGERGAGLPAPSPTRDGPRGLRPPALPAWVLAAHPLEQVRARGPPLGQQTALHQSGPYRLVTYCF